MQRFVGGLFGGQLRNVLMLSFSMIAAITIGVGAVATSRVITEYLTQAADESVARDMDLALAFYRTRMDRIAHVSQRLALSSTLRSVLGSPNLDAQVAQRIKQEVYTEIEVPAINGNLLILVLDRQGQIVVGELLTAYDAFAYVPAGENWASLPIVSTVLERGEAIVATEVIPAEFLTPVGLAGQAFVRLVETPKAAPELYDSREGTAGLAAVGVAPVYDSSEQLAGAVVALHLFNNDFTLVDQIKAVAGVDTATIFFGDLRVSTNVLDEGGERAIGTRISTEVGDQVLFQGLEYPGRAYVVKEWFITRYVPLHDQTGHVVGSLYVGAREATFQTLVHTFVARITYIALGTVCLAALIALPISIAITRPITQLVTAHRKVANGDLTVRVLPVPGKGELPQLAHSFNTMAETLKSAQEQLVHKEKLASVGQLAAGVAHEINNPLGTILLLADVLAKETDKDDPHRQDLDMIIEQARRCKGIVFDLLSFARQNRVMAQMTDVNQLVRRSAEEEGHKESYAQVQVALQLDPNLAIIQADPDQLRQMMTNLMTNAADAMAPHGGVLTICTRMPDRQHVEIKVSDNGCGISDEGMAKLFTPFFTTKPPGKGTGLGLSIIYGIVKMHRGDIRVESEVGKGTTFTVVLPTKLPVTVQVEA